MVRHGGMDPLRNRAGIAQDQLGNRADGPGCGLLIVRGASLCKGQESDYGGRGQADPIMFQTRHIAAVFAALTSYALITSAPLTSAQATSALVPAAFAQSPQRVLVVTCTNPASGTTWQITIDFDHATVDTNPAKVSDAQVAWRDAKDLWNYTLDRKTGELTIIVASSTGGYFLHDTCKLPP